MNDSTSSRPYSTNLITLKHVNIPGDSALNETEQNKEKGRGIRHPLYRGTWVGSNLRKSSLSFGTRPFQSAISRYLVSNACTSATGNVPVEVSIRYIAVLGFQLKSRFPISDLYQVSIRYIAVLGFQRFLSNLV